MLLGPVEIDRTRDFRVKTRHAITDDFRDPSHFRIIRIGIRPPQAHKRIPALALFGFDERLTEFFRNRLRNRVYARLQYGAEALPFDYVMASGPLVRYAKRR